MAPKKKQEKMNLGEFLTNQSLGSWADEMDAQPLPAASSGYGGLRDRDRDMGEKRSFTQPSWELARGGSGMDGRGASYDRPRYAEREQLPLPTRPPYTAHLGNLAYDVTQVDVENFLSDCQVTNVRIVEDKVDRKPKGFGYVEFATLDGLKSALNKTESNFMGRNIKISVAEPPRAESNRDFSNADWSRRGPLPDLPQNTRQHSNRGFNRSFDNMSDAGSERGGSRRPGFFEGDGKVRDFSTWERKGPLTPAPGASPPLREGGRLREGGPSGERRQSPAWGEGRSDAGSRPPRPLADRTPTAAEMDNQWRSKMRPDPSPVPTPEASAPTSPSTKDAPKERPRLNLAKRTVSHADTDAASSSTSDSKASPFGAARPIDTATREREIEEKRQLAIRQKHEADQKAKEEKAAHDTAARAARAERADRGQAQQEERVTSPAGGPHRGHRRPSRQQNGTRQQQPKENGEAQQKDRPSFTILSRDPEGSEDHAAAEAEQHGEKSAAGAPANGTIVRDEEKKPQESVEGAEPASQTPDDGWSTVAGKSKSGRRGAQRGTAS